jgi:hypothetical protein
VKYTTKAQVNRRLPGKKQYTDVLILTPEVRDPEYRASRSVIMIPIVFRKEGVINLFPWSLDL